MSMKKYYLAIFITIDLIITASAPLAARAAWPEGVKCYTDDNCPGAYACIKNPPTNEPSTPGTCIYSQDLYNQLKANNPSLGITNDNKPTVDTSAKINFTPQIPIPNTTISGTIAVDGNLIANYTGALYTYALNIVGVLAIIILMMAGLIWLTSHGDGGQIGKAKKMISGALIGLFLILGANILLRTINPDLINLKPINNITNTKEVVINLVCCNYENTDGKITGIETNTDDCKTKKGSAIPNALIYDGKCEKLGCLIIGSTNPDNTINIKGCHDTFNIKGPDILGITYHYSSSPCNMLSYCFKKSGGDIGINECANIQDGTAVPAPDPGYCYGGKFFSSEEGGKGEPCGNNGGSTCHAKCDGKDIWGGRSCKSGLWCCDSKGGWKD